jgi:hypothetical protein
VTITTPDGKPLPPDLLQKVIDILAQDPEIQALARDPQAALRRKVLGDTDIVVTAKKLRGSILGDVEPSRTFNPIDIRAYGAATISELIGALGDEATSARANGTGRPIVLLNGRRISSFEEIALYPTEVIERMEVFPEALALQYGFAADQKVVNLVTFKFFSQESARIAAGRTTSGGGGQENAGFQILRIIDEKRYNFTVDLGRAGQILESQRNIVQPRGAEGQAPFRSLKPETSSLAVSGSFSGFLNDGAAFTLRGGGGFNRAKALLGVGADGVMSQIIDNYSMMLGAAVGGQSGGWSWSSTSSYRSEISKNKLRTGSESTDKNAFRSEIDFYAIDASLIGSPFRVPAGSALSTMRADFEAQAIDVSGSSGGAQPPPLSRKAFGAFANLTVPLTDRERTQASIGNLSIGGHVRAQRLSDRGTFVNFGSNLNWSPMDRMRFRISQTRETRAPTVDQLRGPVIIVPNVRLFDFSRGDTVDVSQATGGNERLRDEKVSFFNVGAEIKPAKAHNLSITADYISQRTSNAIVAFPILNRIIRDTFPDRIASNSDGQITGVDARPINVRRLDESKMRFGFAWTRAMGSSSASKGLIFSPVSDGPPPPGTLPPNSRIIDSPPGTPLPPEILNALSRVYLGFFYTRRLRSRAILIEGGPDLDLLEGFVLNGFGSSRHELSFSGGVFRQGLGFRANLNWRSATGFVDKARPSQLAGSRLSFTYRPSLDIRFFLNPEERIMGEIPGWVRGVQVNLSIINALNLRPVGRDRAGETPLRFQAGYLDPVGRSVELSLRKLF